MASRIFFDTEFIEWPSSIELISIGLVSEDGQELYLENGEADISRADDWVRTNVLVHLLGGAYRVPRAAIRDRIIAFVTAAMARSKQDKVEFWAYFSDYDWVVFCWLFGRMIDLPQHFPRYCRDFKQTMDSFRIKKSDLPIQTEPAHHALADAKWLRSAFLATLDQHQGR